MEENRAAWVRPAWVPVQPRVCVWVRAGFCWAERGAEAVLGLGSVRGSGRGARLQRQDMSSFSASVVDLESAESEVGKSQKRTHIIIFFLSVFDVLVCSLAAL